MVAEFKMNSLNCKFYGKLLKYMALIFFSFFLFKILICFVYNKLIELKVLYINYKKLAYGYNIALDELLISRIYSSCSNK